MQDFEPVEIQPKSSVGRKAIIAAISVLLVVILAVASALLVKYYVITSFIVDGTSMYPTLDGGDGPNREYPSNESDLARIRTNGETLYLNKLAKIKRGDIIVFVSPEEWNIAGDDGDPPSLVKRVIAVGGDHLELKNGNEVYVNGKLITEPYINTPVTIPYPDFDEVIPSGYVFCMGDNRDSSTDSRDHGFVPLNRIVGKCFLIKGIDGKLRSCK